MAFGLPHIFIPDPLPTVENRSWQIQIPNEEDKKKLFGIELAKSHSNEFEAALVVFPDDTSTSLWVSQNWLSDPIVIASRDLYANTVGVKAKGLDKDQLKAKLLNIVDEKVHGRYIATPLERIKALETYAKISGFIDNNRIDINNNTLIDNKMQIILVKPQQKEETKEIDVTPNLEKPLVSPVSIKLVSNKG